MKSIYKLAFSLTILAVVANTAWCQSDEDADLTRIAGTWSVSLEKSKELLTEDEYAEIEAAAGMDVKMIFGSEDANDAFKMTMGGQSPPGAGDMTFSLTADEDSKDKYKISIVGGPGPMTGSVEFMEKNTIKISPNDSSPAILVREVKVYTLEEAKKMIVGHWAVNVEKTKELMEDSPDEVPDVAIKFNDDDTAIAYDKGQGQDPTAYTFEEGEGDNQFVAKISFGPTAIPFKIDVLDNDTIKIQPENDEAVIFSRKKE